MDILDPDVDLFEFADSLLKDSEAKFEKLLEIAEADKDFSATVRLLEKGELMTSRGQLFALCIKHKVHNEHDIRKYISERKPKHLLNAMMLYWGVYIEAKHICYSRAFQSKDEEEAYVKSIYGRINAALSHSETNQMKDEIINHYRSNKSKFSSKDEAAVYYTTQYPLKHSTIRRYLRNQ